MNEELEDLISKLTDMKDNIKADQLEQEDNTYLIQQAFYVNNLLFLVICLVLALIGYIVYLL